MKKLLLLPLLVLAACNSTESKDITLLDSSLSSILSADAKIEYLKDKDYVVSEGPVWSVKDNGLLFTDVDNNKMFLWQEGKGVSIYMDPSGYIGRMEESYFTHFKVKPRPPRRNSPLERNDHPEMDTSAFL